MLIEMLFAYYYYLMITSDADRTFEKTHLFHKNVEGHFNSTSSFDMFHVFNIYDVMRSYTKMILN